MVATPDLAQRDFNGLPPLNLVFQSLSTDLTANAANVGRIYINSTSGRLRYHKNSTTIVNLDIAGVISDADVAAGAGIQKSKLASLAIIDSDVSSSAAIAQTKLALAITDSQVASGAGIQKSKLASLAIVDSDVASGAAIAQSKLALSITDTQISSSAAISNSKLATNPLLRSNHSGTQTASTISDLATIVQAYRLDQFAAPTSPLSHGGQRATNAADAVGSTDLTTLQQVQNLIDARVNAQDWKPSARVRSTSVSVASPGATVDGVTMNAGDRVLRDAGTADSGLWVWNGSAVAMTRPTDFDSNADATAGATIPIAEGSSADTIWLLTTNDTITLGTTALAFTQIGAAGATYTAGNGLTLTGNTFSLNNVTIANGGTGATTQTGARANLGISRAGALVSQNAALSAGTEASFAHGTGSANGIVDARMVTTKEKVFIKLRSDATNIYVTADVAVASGTLEFLYLPVD